MVVYDHGADKIDLTHLGHAMELRPIEFHFKKDGAKDDKPSISIVMKGISTVVVITAFGQMSLNTLDECLSAVGYKIVKNEEATTN